MILFLFLLFPFTFLFDIVCCTPRIELLYPGDAWNIWDLSKNENEGTIYVEFRLHDCPANLNGEITVDHFSVGFFQTTNTTERLHAFLVYPAPAIGDHILEILVEDDDQNPLSTLKFSVRVLKLLFGKTDVFNAHQLHPETFKFLPLPEPISGFPASKDVLQYLDDGVCQVLNNSIRLGYPKLGAACPKALPAPRPMEIEYIGEEYDGYEYVLELDNAVVNEHGDVYLSEHVILSEGCGFCLSTGIPAACPKPGFSNRETPGVVPSSYRQHYDLVYVISQAHGGGTWHFLAELFPRLFAQEQISMKNESAMIHVVLPNTITMKILEFAGIGEERIIHGLVHADKLILPRATMCDLPTPLLARHAQRFIWSKLDAMGCSDGDDYQVTIVKRWEHHHRCILNHDELVANISLHNPQIKVATYDDRIPSSTGDIMCKFRRAAVVIGPHGAGLSNIIAMRPLHSVIELIPGAMSLPGDISMCYRNMAAIMGLHYYALSPLSSTGYNDGDMIVDATRIALLVQDIISNVRRRRNNFERDL